VALIWNVLGRVQFRPSTAVTPSVDQRRPAFVRGLLAENDMVRPRRATASGPERARPRRLRSPHRNL